MYNNYCGGSQDCFWIILLVIIVLFCFGGVGTNGNYCCPKPECDPCCRHDYNPCC
ncbi:MAG: hypothetical protein R3Y09_02890 [Clostridia bacterium]